VLEQRFELMRATGCLFAVLLSLTVAATTSPIKYVIVLMLENRSFDHMLGFLKQLNQQVLASERTSILYILDSWLSSK
jgi:phospholipase C